MQASHQFVEIERLEQVIVRACLQPLDAMLHRVARGHHEHGQRAALRTPLNEQGHAVSIGRAQVEHAGVKA